MIDIAAAASAYGAMATIGPYRVIIGYNPIDKDAEGCLLGHYSGHQNAKAAAYRKGTKVPVYWWRVEEQTEPDKEWKVRERWQKPAPTQKEIDAAEAKRLGKQLSGLNCKKCGRPLYYVKEGEVERACSRCGHNAVEYSGHKSGKCRHRFKSVHGILERPCPRCGYDGAPVVDLSEILADEIKERNANPPDYEQLGQWVLAGGKPDGKGCKQCLALHGEKMTYGEFVDKQYMTHCGGNCRYDFKPGTTVKRLTKEEIKAALEE